MTDKDDAFLEDLFADVRGGDVDVPDHLRTRVLADAALVPRAPVTASLWAQFVDSLGGWPVLGGVAAAGVTGVWLGLAPPLSVESMASDILGTTTSISFVSDLDDFVEGSLIDG